MPDPKTHAESLSHAIRDTATSFYGLIRSEVRLATAEIQHGAKDAAQRSVRGLVGVALIGLGALTLVAFAVIGLGAILDGRYWLSALVVSVLLVGIGAMLLNASMEGIREDVETLKNVRILHHDRDRPGPS
jgi:uncharacterized membrane protein YqjE